MARRDEIMEIAKGHFARQGYTDTSMRAIAEASGLLAGSLYSHFESKMDLVREIVVGFYDELIARQAEALAAEGNGARRYALMLEGVVGVCSEHRDELTILHYDWHILSSLDELADVKEKSLETLQLWRSVITDGQADGSLDPGVDIDSLMRITTSSVHALLDTVRYSDRPLVVGSSEELAATLRRVLLGGILVDRDDLAEFSSVGFGAGTTS